MVFLYKKSFRFRYKENKNGNLARNLSVVYIWCLLLLAMIKVFKHYIQYYYLLSYGTLFTEKIKRELAF